ncbi:MAG: DUF1593 domain-containing protein [Deltaproteobacteria bacterium]|nr:DUF1593 domain-containing protein [Deltaproteobacteria bacterium]
MTQTRASLVIAVIAGGAFAIAACSESGNGGGIGGTVATSGDAGGASHGGSGGSTSGTGGSGSGGAATGGTSGSGDLATGGSATGGGLGSGGAATGGTSAKGGTTTGGTSARGGTTTGGSTGSGGAVTGGTAGQSTRTGGSGTGGTAGETGSGGTGTGGSQGTGTGGVGSGGATGTGGGTTTGGSTGTIDPKRYRYVHTSDFPPIPVTNSDPDDVQTIVRLLLYSNELDIEGFIASAGTYSMVANKKNYDTVWAAYEKVYDSLKKHDAKYPTPTAMRAITYEGKGNNSGISIQWGCNKQSADSLIGKGKDSEASNALIAIVDKPDPRPLWIGVAGGPREVAQAIWDVKNTRSEAEASAFIAKLRVFLIACQDGTHQYIMSVPGLFVIESKSTYAAFFCGGGSNCNKDWVTTNVIQNHGALGAIYPDHGSAVSGVQEGDSPAFMHLISGYRGINDPEKPDQAGWGGQYKRDGSSNRWLDGSGASISAGRDAYQKEFAERADWMVQ